MRGWMAKQKKREANPKSFSPEGTESHLRRWALFTHSVCSPLLELRPRAHQQLTKRVTMQAVRPSLRALQASLLNHLRVPVLANVRTMSEDAHAHGTYLDRRDVIDRVLSVVKSSPKVDASKVLETATFKDMGLDSLDEVEVVMSLEEEFALEIPDAEADKIRSAIEAIDYIASHPMAK